MKNRLLSIILTSIALGACASAQPAGITEESGGWKIWEGRGTINISEKALVYEPVSFQDEDYDYDIEGRGPAAIAAKEIKGKNWTLDIKPAFLSDDKIYNRYTIGLWFGNKELRPCANNQESASLLLRRTRGPNPKDGNLILEFRNEGKTKTVAIPMNASLFRFQRNKNKMTFFYSIGYRPNFKESFSTQIPKKTQVHFISGARMDGKFIGMPKLRITKLELNGNNILK